MQEQADVRVVRAWLRRAFLHIEIDTKVEWCGGILRETSRTQAAGARIVLTNLWEFIEAWQASIDKGAGVEPKGGLPKNRATGNGARILRVVRKKKLVSGDSGVNVGAS